MTFSRCQSTSCHVLNIVALISSTGEDGHFYLSSKPFILLILLCYVLILFCNSCQPSTISSPSLPLSFAMGNVFSREFMPGCIRQLSRRMCYRGLQNQNLDCNGSRAWLSRLMCYYFLGRVVDILIPGQNDLYAE
jgi:hypothetical protein